MPPVHDLCGGGGGYQRVAVHALGSGAGQVTPPCVWSCTLRERIIAEKRWETRDACRRWPWRSYPRAPDAPLGLPCPPRARHAAGLYWPACRALLRGRGAPAPQLLDTSGACRGMPQRTHAWRSSCSPQGAGRWSRRGQRPPCLRDTKPLGTMGQAALALPGVRVSQIWGDTTLLLCQDESPRASQAPMRHAWSDRASPGTCGAILASPACRAVPARHGVRRRSGSQAADRVASPAARGVALGCRGHAVRTPDGRSQPCAT